MLDPPSRVLESLIYVALSEIYIRFGYILRYEKKTPFIKVFSFLVHRQEELTTKRSEATAQNIIRPCAVKKYFL